MHKISSDKKLQANKFKLWRSIDNYHAPQGKELNKNTENEEAQGGFRQLIERGAAANLNRKSFLTLMGASLGMAALQCSKEPLEKIVPYVTRPPETFPGIAVYYASAQLTSEKVTPVLLKTREGKPIHVEGHSDHPLTQGAVTADTYASIWDLYDPDRVKEPQKRNGETFAATTWKEVLAALIPRLNETAVVLSRPSFSPSEKSVLQEVLALGNTKQVVYDPIGNQQEVLEGERLSYGKTIIPQYRFDKADVILAVDADFLGTWLSPEVFSRQFSKRRNPDNGDMNHLMVAESMMSLTGSNADARYVLHSGSQKALLLGLANFLGSTQAKVKVYTLKKTAELTGLPEEKIKEIGERLQQARGKSLVVAGGPLSRSGNVGELQVAANLLNNMLGNDGKTVFSQNPMKTEGDISSPQKLQALLDDMKAGKIKTLIIDRANPFFDLPRTSGFQEALAKVEVVAVIGSHMDDTAVKAHWLLPVSHYLESWSDALFYGYYMPVQPVIRPLHNTKCAGDVWLSLLQILKEGTGAASAPATFYDYIRKNIAPAYLSADFERDWSALIARGFVSVNQNADNRSFSAEALNVLSEAKIEGDFRLNLYQSVLLGDGSGGNISFRHELPDPVSKVTWDNYLAVSYADAHDKNWKSGDVVQVSFDEQSLEVPVSVQPGIKKGNLFMAFGYGHEEIGQVGKDIGVNAWQVADFVNGSYRMAALPVAVKKTTKKHRIVTTQTHDDMAGRDLAKFTSFSEYKKHPHAGNHEHNMPAGPDGVKGLYKDVDYSQVNRWVMNIDLTKCTGCTACVMGCYSENNVPAVGKKEISVGREMTWLRIDRYYYSAEHDAHAEANVHQDMENPAVIYQPVMCQHCENAPCENVCPVGATSHSYEGLNDMAYNRCIGTRYCADNCPYKVRRFNWFENWSRKIRDPQQFALNPDVTVRSRGVIEKCSFCVQRINEKRQVARLENRPVREDELKTACQQGCPTEAIHFGNANDRSTFVGANETNPRQYRLLEEINTRPRVQYMTRIVNRV